MKRDTRIELLASARDGLVIEGIVVVVMGLLLAFVVNGSGIAAFVNANLWW